MDRVIRPPIDSVTIVILAGGKSSRFGSNKALAPWGQQGSILENIVQVAKSACPRVALSVRSPGDYPSIKMTKFPDIVQGKGPLGGLYSAIQGVDTSWIMILACDMPLVQSGFIKYMLEIKTWAPVIVPAVKGRFEPLHAVYHRSLLPLVENLLKRDRLCMRALFDMVPVYAVKEQEMVRAAGSLVCLSNINTMVEFKRLAPSAVC